MKAILVDNFGKTSVMKYVDVDIPKTKPKQALIQVARSSVGFADVKSRYGKK